MKQLSKIKLVGFANPKSKLFTVRLTRFECVLLACWIVTLALWLVSISRLDELRGLALKQLSTPTAIVAKPMANTNLNFFDTP